MKKMKVCLILFYAFCYTLKNGPFDFWEGEEEETRKGGRGGGGREKCGSVARFNWKIPVPPGENRGAYNWEKKKLKMKELKNSSYNGKNILRFTFTGKIPCMLVRLREKQILARSKFPPPPFLLSKIKWSLQILAKS